MIKSQFIEAQSVLENFVNDETNFGQILKASQIISTSIKQGGKVISCGNGGSHCDAMHFAEELTGRYRESREALPAISISDPSHISCVANDFGFNNIFSRYVEALGQTNDVLLAISTSGNSLNIINAILAAKSKRMKTIALTGKDGGGIRGKVDVEINVPHFGYADRIQEVHIKIIHSIILTVEDLILNP